MGVTKAQAAKFVELASLSEEKQEAKIAEMVRKAEAASTGAPRHAKSEFSGETEWYTPNEYLDLPRTVLGGIVKRWRRQRVVQKLKIEGGKPSSSAPTKKTEPTASSAMTREEFFQKLSNDPQFVEVGKPGDGFMIAGAKPSQPPHVRHAREGEGTELGCHPIKESSVTKIDISQIEAKSPALAFPRGA
jgi:hypothetical protein